MVRQRDSDSRRIPSVAAKVSTNGVAIQRMSVLAGEHSGPDSAAGHASTRERAAIQSSGVLGRLPTQEQSPKDKCTALSVKEGSEHPIVEGNCLGGDAVGRQLRSIAGQGGAVPDGH